MLASTGGQTLSLVKHVGFHGWFISYHPWGGFWVTTSVRARSWRASSETNVLCAIRDQGQSEMRRRSVVIVAAAKVGVGHRATCSKLIIR